MEHLLLSAGERSSGRLNPETLDRACNQVRLNGYVVLANAMPTDFIDRLWRLRPTRQTLENRTFASGVSAWIRLSVRPTRTRSWSRTRS